MPFLATIADELQSSIPYYTCTHIRPDGDAVGSQIAFTRYLNSLKIKAFCVLTHDIPRNLQTLIKDTPCIYLEDIEDNAGALIALDCADLTRLPASLKNLTHFLNIDHHPNNPNFAKHNYVRDNFSSTCEILITLFKEVCWNFDLIAAQALYAGLVTDTGNFSHSNVSANTFACAAHLLQCTHLQPYTIIQSLFEQKTLAQIRLLSLFLSRIQLHCNEQIACIELTQDDYIKTNTQHSDTEGFIAHALTIQNVKIAAFIEYNENFVKGSLRSKSPHLTVNQVARQFGGFGHICAAGFQCDVQTFNRHQLLQALANLIEQP
ncbi:MAG: bifunctional oligoribonuclease/PAP phosphatase NrnA [Puniceicoccales bacterium]|jgi:phosphoesterase RecJ-like protein|nr:bifunctional oligoribonuclease/PAP phosphatase NrnA [Puniceicoccales bacterium]